MAKINQGPIHADAMALTEAKEWAAKLIYPLRDGNLEAVCSVLKSYTDSKVRNIACRGGIDTPLTTMGVSIRTTNALDDGLGIVTLRDLLEVPGWKTIIEMPGFGETMMIEMLLQIVSWLSMQLPNRKR